MFFQPEPVRAAVRAAQGSGAVWLAAGAEPHVLLAVEAIAVADAAPLGKLAELRIVRVGGADLDRSREGQIVMSRLLVPARLIRELDALGKGLHKRRLRSGKLDDFIVAERTAGHRQQRRRRHHLQDRQALPRPVGALDPQKDPGDLLVRAVHHPDLQETLARLQIAAQPAAADPDRAVGIKEVLRPC